jgi:hypothetical protein
MNPLPWKIIESLLTNDASLAVGIRIDSHFDTDFSEMRAACLVTKRLDQVL